MENLKLTFIFLTPLPGDTFQCITTGGDAKLSGITSPLLIQLTYVGTAGP